MYCLTLCGQTTRYGNLFPECVSSPRCHQVTRNPFLNSLFSRATLVFAVPLVCEHANMCKKLKFKIPIRGLKRPISPAKKTAPTDSNLSRQGFTRGNTKSNQNLKAQYNNGQSQSPISQQAPPLPALTNSPSISSTYSEQSGYVEQQPKKFLDERYAKCSVKGNFLTLAAQPKNVELGEWLAHQREWTQFWRIEMVLRLIQYSGRDESTPNWHDSSYSRGRHQYWSSALQRAAVSYNVCWTVCNLDSIQTRLR